MARRNKSATRDVGQISKSAGKRGYKRQVGKPAPRCTFAEQLQHRRTNLRLGVDFQATAPRVPGLVAAKFVLLGSWQVATVPVGQLDDKRGLQGAALLDRQPRLGEDLAGDGSDAQFADADRLKLVRHGGWALAQEDRLLGIERSPAVSMFALGVGQDLSGPGKPRFVRSSDSQLQLGLAHRQGHPVAVVDLAADSQRRVGQSAADLAHSFVRRQLGPRLAETVGTAYVAAGSVGHDAYKRRLQRAGAEQLPNPRGEHAEVVGADLLPGEPTHVVN